MAKSVSVIFGGDSSIKNEEKKAYIKFVNETLANFKKEIHSDQGYIKAICRNGLIQGDYVSGNRELHKTICSKLSSETFH